MSLHDQLSRPFEPHEIEWRVGQVAKSKERATLLAYLTARAVMDRLDEVVGPENWQDTYRQGPDGGVLCALSIRCGDAWVTKEDGGENTQIEAVKGGLSDSFKRAAVKWGIGRYLYKLDSSYHEIHKGWAKGDDINVAERGAGHLGHIKRPKLPAWAMPPKQQAPKATPSPQATPAPTRWSDGERTRFCAIVSGWGIKYDTLAAWCESKGRPRPSGMSGHQREKLLGWLEAMDADSRIAAVGGEP